MLTVTDIAIDAINEVAPGDGGLRLYAAGLPAQPGEPAFRVEVVDQPGPQDRVVDADGARVFLDPAAATLFEGKILDATLEGSTVRFTVAERA